MQCQRVARRAARRGYPVVVQYAGVVRGMAARVRRHDEEELREHGLLRAELELKTSRNTGY